jgi:hypothetical protein
LDGSSIRTGPGFPVRRWWKARRISSNTRVGSLTSAAHLVTGRKFCTGSNEGGVKLRPTRSPGMSNTGTLSPNTCAAPGKLFSTPGPPCIENTPVRLP